MRIPRHASVGAASYPLPGYTGFRVGIKTAGLPQVSTFKTATIYDMSHKLRVPRRGRHTSEILSPNRTALLAKLPKTTHPFDRTSSQLKSIYHQYRSTTGTKLPAL